MGVPRASGVPEYGPGGTINYNPDTPGNVVYNPAAPGAAGAAYNVLGVTFPGGAPGAKAPLVGETLVVTPYVANGLPINVGYDSQVVIKEV